jgi:hypothetical protein
VAAVATTAMTTVGAVTNQQKIAAGVAKMAVIVVARAEAAVEAAATVLAAAVVEAAEAVVVAMAEAAAAIAIGKRCEAREEQEVFIFSCI